MEDIYGQADLFIMHVKSRPEYIEFNEKLKEIEENKALYTRLNDFRRERFLIQSGGNAKSQEELKIIGSKYEDVIRNPIVQEFLMSEEKLFKLLRNLNAYVLENLEIGIDFLEG